jgi:predicted RNA-binding protein YlqC (UPF0109 family)
VSSTPLDPVEAARVALSESEALSRAARRLVAAADLLERAAASFAAGLLADRPPDGGDLLGRHGRTAEALAAAASALDGLEDGLGSLRFAFTDEPEPEPRLRARALDELRAHLARRRG